MKGNVIKRKHTKCSLVVDGRRSLISPFIPATG
jgi:hypothetical protein